MVLDVRRILNVYCSITAFVRPEVSLCGWKAVNIQLLGRDSVCVCVRGWGGGWRISDFEPPNCSTHTHVGMYTHSVILEQET